MACQGHALIIMNYDPSHQRDKKIACKNGSFAADVIESSTNLSTHAAARSGTAKLPRIHII